MARYRKLDLRTWSDQKFRELSRLPPSGQSLWLYMILGPQTTNIPGLFESSEISLADKLKWPLEAFREAFKEACSKGMAKADWNAGLVWLPRAPAYNKPESPNVVRSWGSVFDELPECDLKRQAYHALKAFAEGWGQAYLEAFGEALAKPSAKAMPNQEQEQKQEQKQEHTQSASVISAGGEGKAPEPAPEARFTPYAAMSIELRKQGVNVTAIHPTLVAWVDDGYPVEHVLGALAKARETKGDNERIAAAYLDPIVRAVPRTNGSASRARVSGEARTHAQVMAALDAVTDWSKPEFPEDEPAGVAQ